MFISKLVALSTLVSLVVALPKGESWKMRRQAADLQTALSLDPSLVQTGLQQDGTGGDGADPNQVPSLTSKNNFINFCATQDVSLTNGLQIKGGSCNPTPMGRVISKDLIPASKFIFPKNGDTSLVEGQNFTIQMAIKNIQTGNFVNAAACYYMAPQVTNDQGVLIGHSHVVIQKIESLSSTKPLDPNGFDFFKGMNLAADANGVLTAPVDKGLPAGFYRMTSINAGMNHQPALVAVAQHGSIDDGVYFTVQPAGGAATATA